MPKNTELELLENIDHHIQTGFLALVAIGQQIRDAKTGEPNTIEIEKSADFLRRVSAILGAPPE